MSSRSTRRGFFVLAVLGLAILSVKPVGVVEQALDVALLPVRLLSEATRPVGWLRMPRARAAEGVLASRLVSDFDRRQALFEDSERYALPDPARFPGRRFVLAEVVDRDPDSVDRVVVELESRSCEGLVEGLPVVSGDIYVGRVERVDHPRAGQALVALITGRGAFIGARLVTDAAGPGQGAVPDGAALGREPVRMVVGGVVPAREVTARDGGARGARDEFLLAIHNPSRRELPPGRVVVDEGPEAASEQAALADGFELGRPVENGGDPRRPSFGVEPLLDYRTGLFQLVVVCPADLRRAPERPTPDVLEDPEAWIAVAVTSSGDPAAWREGLKLGGGSWDGLRAGAAVVSGSHLVGRVKRAAPLWADVALLGDPGFRVPALARIEGRAQPLVLGSLVTLGREEDGARVRFAWNARAPRTVSEPVQAEIFTGSGELRVPRGLLLGVAELPAGEGVHELTIAQPVDTRDVRKLWVQSDARAGQAELEGTPP